MKVLLLNPPVSDPTCPYSSLYHLKSHIVKNSTHEVFVKDLNIEWLNYLINENYTDKFLDEVKTLKKTFEEKENLSTYEALWYYKLIDPDLNIIHDNFCDAVSVLKDKVEFYNVNKYIGALENIRKLLLLIYPVQKLTAYVVPKLLDMVSKRIDCVLTEKELSRLLFLSFFDGIL